MRCSAFRQILGPDDVVLTPPGEVSVYLAAYTGCRSVTGLYTHLLDDTEERTAGVEAFFDPTRERLDRIEVLQKYKVTKVVVPLQSGPEFISILGEPRLELQDFTVFDLTRPQE